MHIQSLYILLGIAIASPGPVGDQPSAQVIAIELDSFEFTPSTIAMTHGQSYVLRLTNVSDGDHDFAAPRFFDAARIAPQDSSAVAEGRVEVPGRETVSIRLTAPARGTYRIRCTHFMHSTFGMKGRIVVT